MEESEQVSIQLSLRGKRLLFQPDVMTIAWLGGGDDEPINVRRIDSSATEMEARARQEKLDNDRTRVVGQLMGEKTWKLSDLERGRMLAEQQEQKKRDSRVPEAERSSDPTH